MGHVLEAHEKCNFSNVRIYMFALLCMFRELEFLQKTSNKKHR
jgi:hypothetical protein